MNAPSNKKILLFYKPPNGKWYVHSHKLYGNAGEARAAAREFLSPGTPYALKAVQIDSLDAFGEIV